MADLPKALAGLITALLATQGGQPVDRKSLERMLNALEELDDDPAAAAELQDQIQQARDEGKTDIDSAPVGLLQVLTQSDKGGREHE